MKNCVWFALGLLACGGKSDPVAVKGAGSGSGSGSGDKPGIELVLSNGVQSAAAVDHSQLAPTKPLADTAALFARTQPIKVDADDVKAAALREASQPPPLTGERVATPFPPPPSLRDVPAAATTAALKVERFMPEGKVATVPQLSVTFTQPMVAVGTQASAAATLPVKLTPAVKGTWRWIGARTIVFDPAGGHFPMATTYHVEVAAGTKGVNGGPLDKAVAFDFETPRVTVVDHMPSGNADLDAPIFVEFDQAIDPQAVLALAQLSWVPNGGQDPKDPWRPAPPTALTLQLVDDAKVTDKAIAARIAAMDKDHAGRHVVVKATQPFAPNSTVTLSIAPGLASKEGPNRTAEPLVMTLATYPPFEVVRNSCDKSPCGPEGGLYIELSNPIDMAAFKDAQVSIVPAIPDVRVEVAGTGMSIYGTLAPKTTYKATLKQALADIHHQTLARDITVELPVGPATPMVWGANGIVVTDPLASRPKLDYFSSQYPELKVQLFKVTPDDFAKFQTGAWLDPTKKSPGTALPVAMVKTAGNALLDTTEVDISSALANGRGQVVAVVEPSPWIKPKQDAPRFVTWAQATHLAIDAHVDQDQLVVFASDLATGAAVAGATIALRPDGTTATTDARGIATLPRPNGSEKRQPAFIIATHGEDSAVLPGDAWARRTLSKELEWHVFDDRQLYRPGEQVSVKGWLRFHDPNRGGDLHGVGSTITAVAYKLLDSEENQIGSGKATVNALGGFDLRATLPNTPNLGSARFVFTTQGYPAEFEHDVRVEEFRRPDFEATAHAQTEPFIVGAGGDVTVGARYYAGGPLGGAKVTWSLYANQTSYRPPNRDDYVFGVWAPWWEHGGGGESSASHLSFTSKTDGGGEHVLHVDAKRVAPATPYSVSATATVEDVNHQDWSAYTSFIVHPSSLYVGISTKQPFVTQGEPYELSVIGVDLDGKTAPGAKVSIDVVRTTSELVDGKRVVKDVDPQHCDVTTAKDPVPCKLATPHGGEYTVRATIVDAKQRPNRTELRYWVSGGEPVEMARDVAQQTVELIPDKQEYTVGNTAELLVRAPFAPAEGIVTYRRSGIVKTERIVMKDGSAVISLPVTDDLVPNVDVQVDLVGAAPRTDAHGKVDPKAPLRPAYAVGQLQLSIPPKQRSLKIAVAPSVDKLAPGDAATIAVTVTDAAGKPVANADVAVYAVDDSVLALAQYSVVDPLSEFYPQRPTETADFYQRAYLQLARRADPDTGYGFGRSGFGPGGGGNGWGTIGTGRYGTIGHGSGMGSGYGVGGGKGAFASLQSTADISSGFDDSNVYGGLLGTDKAPQEQKPMDTAMPTTAIAVRSNFNPLAVFASSVHTDASGRVVVPVTMPDNLTRYRVIAVAAAGERQFGKGESTMTARLPLMVRATPPRFLSFGDTFALPITLQNQTDAAMTVKLGVRASNLTVTNGGVEVQVPANDHVLVEIPAAAQAAGTARLQIVAASGAVADAQELALPVWTPATTEAFATYGVIDDGAVRQPITLPEHVLPSYGGLEVATASTNLQALTDALIYLVRYPYECSEQRSSRILAIAGLRDVLSAFHANDLPSAAVLARSVDTDLDWLVKVQSSNGGFGFWKKDEETEFPYLGIYVPFVLANAKAKGYAIPAELFTRSLEYLKAIDDHIPAIYGPEERTTLEAFALYTRKLLGNLDIPAAQQLARNDKLSLDAQAWLLATLAGNASASIERTALTRALTQHVTETAGAASISSGYDSDGYLVLGSDGRTTGLVLDALIQDQPTSTLIPKLVTGLLASRKRGHWDSTQEDGFVLVSLDRYFRTYEKTTPSFVARIWLGTDYAGDHAFRGRTTETALTTIPMTAVAAHDKADLTIQKDGPGRLYYRIASSYAPADLHIEPAEHGFVVQRHYEAVDDKADVTRDAKGVWHVKAGARVRVRLEMVNAGRRHHVALVDPLPAGFEAVNPELAGTRVAPSAEQKQTDRYWWFSSVWYEHQNLRDERVESFALDLWEGVHPLDYIARATTRGTFIAAPPKAEEMYAPETFGRGASEIVIVE